MIALILKRDECIAIILAWLYHIFIDLILWLVCSLEKYIAKVRLHRNVLHLCPWMSMKIIAKMLQQTIKTEP